MADEVIFTAGAKSTPPAGTKIATDTVGGKEIQFVKLDIGGDGLSSPVSGALPVYDVSGVAVNITNNVIVTGSIQVSNFPNLQGVSGSVSVNNFPAMQGVSGSLSITPPIMQGISGTVAVSNFPSMQGVSGTVHVDNLPPNMQGVSGSVGVNNFPILQGISGSVNVSNFPTFPVQQGISGSVSISNFPVMQGISGSVTVTPPIQQGISGTVAVSNFPVLQGVSGSVNVNNFPVQQGISGTVNVGNFPAQTLVTGSIGVVGNVNIGNYPTQQGISGSVSVSNFPVQQGISGTVAVSNFPVQQGISGTVTFANSWIIVSGTVSGNVAHDGIDAGAPIKVGMKAISHGANPIAVAANDRTDAYANIHGVQFVMGGHPNIITTEWEFAATGTSNNALITVAGGTKIVITQCQAVCDNANTVDVGVRVGFGAANTPTTTGVILTHPGIAAGSGVSRGDGSGILGVGADGDDVRVTSESPTSGALRILISYFTIES